MPMFDTPEPISATIEPGIGSVTIVASDRTNTVVEVRPTDPGNESDVDAARRTTVDFAGGALTVKAPKMSPFSGKKTRSIDITIELPVGSHVHGVNGVGDLTATGRLGDISYKTGVGHVRFDEAAALSVTSATGNVLGRRVTGKATVATASGRLQLGELIRGGELKNSNGTTVIGAVRGPVRVRSANGDITIEEAAGDIEAKTANGAIRVLGAESGSLTLQTAMGEIEVGISRGSAAWLDVRTKFGRVHNEMAATAAPADDVDKVEIHATTSFGDVLVHSA